MTRAKLILKSENRKTGPMPVSYSDRFTCPDACPLKNNGCYTELGPSSLIWGKVTRGEWGVEWQEFCDQVRKLPLGVLWRHNIAGDLPGKGDEIDWTELSELVRANLGKTCFTFTHKPMTYDNEVTILAAIALGFTINASTHSLKRAAALHKRGIPASVVVRDTSVHRRVVDGVPISVCPAYLNDKITCTKCGICARPDRPVVVAFPVHGSRSRVAAETCTE